MWESPARLSKEAYSIFRTEGARELGYRSLLYVIPNSLKYHYWSRNIRRQAAAETDADPLKILWIEPTDIERCTGTIGSGPNKAHLDHNDAFPPEPSQFGSVAGGDWDLDGCAFKQLAVYAGLREWYTSENTWETTNFYRRHVNNIESHGVSFGCESSEGLLYRLKRTELLFHRIQKEGYKTQRELGGKPHREIVVNIARDGEILFNGGGRHRLAIAKILEIEKIPVVVLVRHQQWQEVRDQVVERGHLPRKVATSHPDLHDIQ